MQHFKFVFLCLCAPSVYPICHYFVVSLSSVLMVASIYGHLPLLAACHCSLLLLLKIVNVLTWQINSLSHLSASINAVLLMHPMPRPIPISSQFLLLHMPSHAKDVLGRPLTADCRNSVCLPWYLE